MGFTEDVESQERGGYLARGCGVGVMLDQLARADREEVRSALDRAEITSTAIHRALLMQDWPDVRVPSASTIQRHRKGACTCGR